MIRRELMKYLEEKFPNLSRNKRRALLRLMLKQHEKETHAD